MDEWRKDVAPSDALRRWSGRDPAGWEEFKRRYFAELDADAGTWRGLPERARQHRVTLLFAARDPERKNPVALKLYLEQSERRARPKRTGKKRSRRVRKN